MRPPTSYTGPLELKLLLSYGLPENSSRTELDHLISLELGGAPDDPRNLFPEPYAGKLGAGAKDALENRLHTEVCAGAIKLRAAQVEIVHWMRYATPTSAPSPDGSGSGPVVKPEPGGHCVSGYSPCISPGPDVDCQGGSGDGPRYVQGPIRVSGRDPYQLDSDGNGVGC